MTLKTPPKEMQKKCSQNVHEEDLFSSWKMQNTKGPNEISVELTSTLEDYGLQKLTDILNEI